MVFAWVLLLANNMLHFSVSEAVILKTLSYQEAWEMVKPEILRPVKKFTRVVVKIFSNRRIISLQSYFGANVLHPRTIIPVMRYGIPIIIRNIFNLSAPGTMICRSAEYENENAWNLESSVKGFATIDNLALVNVEG